MKCFLISCCSANFACKSRIFGFVLVLFWSSFPAMFFQFLKRQIRRVKTSCYMLIILASVLEFTSSKVYTACVCLCIYLWMWVTLTESVIVWARVCLTLCACVCVCAQEETCELLLAWGSVGECVRFSAAVVLPLGGRRQLISTAMPQYTQALP